jgi:hypothetical protein
MAWDSSFFNTADPDQIACMKLVVHCDPDFPLPLAIVECASDMPIDIRIKRLEVQQPGSSSYEIAFTGKCMDLMLLDVNIKEWSNRIQGVQRLTGEENTDERSAQVAEEGNPGSSV